MKLRFSRRRFLASSTLSAVSALPFTTALAPEAQAKGNAKFLVVFYHPFGVYGPEWYPQATGRTFTFKKASAPLEAIKNDLIVFSNLDNAMGEKNECANGLDQHQAGVSSIFASATMKPGRFGSGPGAATIDSVIARHLVPGKHHDDVVVNLGIRSTEHFDHWIRYLFRKTDGSIVESQDDPVKAFRALFGNGGAGMVAPPQKPFSGLKDALKEDLTAFERGLAQPERLRFQQYMASFAAFEQSLETELRPENLCKDLPSADNIAGQLMGGHRSPNIWVTAKLQAQLATLALSCGARRVATIHLTDGFRTYVVPAGATPDTANCYGHDLSHHTNVPGDPVRLRTNLNYRQAQFFVELVKGLKGATNPLTGTGSVFDDAVVLWSSCISGAGGGGHSKLRVPFTLAAGRNAGFVTGRHLNANFGTNGMLLRGVCNAFGMPDQTFGDAEFCPSALGGLTEDVGIAGNYPRKVMDYLKLTARCRGHAT